MRAVAAYLVLCACPIATVAPVAPITVVSAAPVARGASPHEPWCDREVLAAGPVTVAGNWGPGGASVGCRTGPSPVRELQRRLATDARLRACLNAFDAEAFEVELEISADGRVADVAVLDAAPRSPEACVASLYRLRFMALGCRWRAGHRWRSL